MKLIFDVLPVDKTLGRLPEVVAEPYPAPEIYEGAAVDAVAPGRVRTLINLGQACGWTTRLVMSIGSMPHATTGRPGPRKTWWGVRLKRPEWSRQAYAVFDEKFAAWHSIGMAGLDFVPLMVGGRTDLSAFLAERVGADWRASVIERVRAQEAAAKLVAAARPKKAKQTEGL